MAENTYRLSNPFSRIVGFSFGATSPGDFYMVSEIDGVHVFQVFKIDGATPTLYSDSMQIGMAGFARMIKTLDKVFGLHLNEFDQYRALSGGVYSDYGSPLMNTDYTVALSLIATADKLGSMSRATAGFDRMLTDSDNDVTIAGSGPTAQFRAIESQGEMFMVAQDGNDATVVRLNVGSTTHDVLYTHSTADQSIEGMGNGQIKKGPVANLLDDLAFVVMRGLDGVAVFGFDIYVNGSIEKAADAPASGNIELVNIQSFDQGFGYAYLTTPASGNPSIHVGTLTWNGSAYVDAEQSFEINVSGGAIQNFALGVGGDGIAHAWAVHTYDDGISVRLRAAVFPSDGLEQEYQDTNTFSLSFAFYCIEAISLHDRVLFLIDNNSSSGDGVSGFGTLAFVDSFDVSSAGFSAGGTDTFSPVNLETGTAYEPGYLRATSDRAFVVALHSATSKYHLLGSDATDVVLDDQVTAFTSRTYKGMIPKQDRVYAMLGTVTTGPVSHTYHIDDQSAAVEYSGAEDISVIPRAKIMRLQEIQEWAGA